LGPSEGRFVQGPEAAVLAIVIFLFLVVELVANEGEAMACPILTNAYAIGF
jgi:hypothetical protein